MKLYYLKLISLGAEMYDHEQNVLFPFPLWK